MTEYVHLRWLELSWMLSSASTSMAASSEESPGISPPNYIYTHTVSIYIIKNYQCKVR